MRSMRSFDNKTFYQYTIVTIYNESVFGQNVIIHFEYFPSENLRETFDIVLQQINLETDCDYKFEDIKDYCQDDNEVSFSLDSTKIFIRKVD